MGRGHGDFGVVPRKTAPHFSKQGMKMLYKLKKYRVRYEAFLGVKIPRGFDVHHINHNSKDHGIHNLVAIPIELHKRYHGAKHFYHALEREFGYPVARLLNKHITLNFRFDKLYPGQEEKQGFIEEARPAYYRFQFLRCAVIEYKKHQTESAGKLAFTWI